MTFAIDRFSSPIGTILLVSDGRSLCALDYLEYEERMMRLLGKRAESGQLVDTDDPQGFSSAVRAYFSGRFDALDDLPVNLGGTAFQNKVWAQLRRIPVGTTTTYGAIAARLGAPSASRAVGMANGLNPVAIVVPCHRVIGANATLTGYAGGLGRKKWLLQHEGAPLREDLRQQAFNV